MAAVLAAHVMLFLPEGAAADIPRSDSVSVVDTTSGAPVAEIAVGQLPVGLAVAPDGSRVYVSNRDSASISILDTATNSLIGTASVPGVPEAVALLPDASRLYVADRKDSSVLVLDTTIQTVVASVPVEGVPEALAASADGSVVCAGTSSPDQLVLIDPTTNAISGTLPLSDTPQGIASSADGRQLYVTTYHARQRTGGALVEVDTATASISATITFDASVPQVVVPAPDRLRAFVTHLGTLGVSVVDLSGLTVLGDVDLPGLPAGMAIAPDGSQVYIATGVGPGQLTILNSATGQITGTVLLAGTAQGVAAAPDGSRVYVAHRSDGQ